MPHHWGLVTMSTATLRCYGSLNDFLPAARQQVAFTQPFVGRPSVKDTIEAAGVPHPEIDLVLVNGEPVDLAHRLDDGARIAVFPAFRSIPLDGLGLVEPLAGDPRFVLDGHLGRLARSLRMLGFDTWYRSDADDGELAGLASAEARILLTRDRGLLRRSVVGRGAFVRSDRPREQLGEIVERYDLAGNARPFTRCIRCNEVLVATSLADVVELLEPLTKRYYTDFRRCPGCGAVYWRGSHHRRMAGLVDAVIGPGWRNP